MTRNGIVPIERAAFARSLAPAEHPPGRNGDSFVEWHGSTVNRHAARKPRTHQRRPGEFLSEMCDRSQVVCVDWRTLPIKEAISTPDSARYPEPMVYVIEANGAPLYVGFTQKGLASRLRQHRFARTPVGALIKKACDGLIDLDVRATQGSADLERQVILALQPEFNVQGRIAPVFPLRLRWPDCPELRIAMHRVVALRMQGFTVEHIRDYCGVSHERIRKMLTWYGADGKPWMGS